MTDKDAMERLRDALAYIYDPEDFNDPPFESVADAWAEVNKWLRDLAELDDLREHLSVAVEERSMYRHERDKALEENEGLREGNAKMHLGVKVVSEGRQSPGVAGMGWDRTLSDAEIDAASPILAALAPSVNPVSDPVETDTPGVTCPECGRTKMGYINIECSGTSRPLNLGSSDATSCPTCGGVKGERFAYEDAWNDPPEIECADPFHYHRCPECDRITTPDDDRSVCECCGWSSDESSVSQAGVIEPSEDVPQVRGDHHAMERTSP